MPPSVRDWLPEDHLAWFVLDAVAGMGLSSFYEAYREDGRGGAAYDPSMMVALLVYAYARGERSSRAIERRCREDVAYRVICGNRLPDHATIARFRARHEAALAGLFDEVLVLCAEAGLIRVGLIAVDGTRMEANAAKSASVSEARLGEAISAEVARILAEAKAVDEAEDARYGEARGDELPPGLADRSSRLARLGEARVRLAQRREGEQRGPRSGAAKANTTDPDSRLLKTQGGFVQGYNAQAAVAEGQIVVAAEVCDQPADVAQLKPMVSAAVENVAAAGIADPVESVAADAGYWSAANAALELGPELFIATTKASRLVEAAAEPEPLPPRPLRRPPNTTSHQRRVELIEVVDRGEMTLTAAARAMGLDKGHASVMWKSYRSRGPDAIPRPQIPAPPKPDLVTSRRAMNTKLTSPHGQALYARRAQIVEPVFGQIKAGRGIRRFARRGLPACRSEWKLMTATHNLLKLWRAQPAIA